MRKKITVYFISTIAFLIIVGIIVTFPHSDKINQSIKGGQYSKENEAFIPVTINIKGKITYSIVGKKQFKGTIIIDGEGYTDDPNNIRKLRMTFYKSGEGLMAYLMDFDGFAQDISTNGPVETEPYNSRFGRTYVDKDFGKIFIEVADTTENVYISGPASNTTQAIEISKELAG